MKILKRFWDISSWIIIILLVLFITTNLILRIAGIKIYNVSSGSMEPTLKIGSLIYVEEEDADDYEVSDIISFKLKNGLVGTHRIIEVIRSEDLGIQFQTKGDNNPDKDAALVDFQNVIGKVVFVIPILGYVFNFIKQPPGLYITISLISIILIVMIVKRKR